ncbi:Thymidylate kinase [hydrothermal vent metagenome]|uniref:dTMP kinase n=1 Tax=hydrothermal vent metagenome TaxID=652676 RepID=A0A3B0U085_9ZZZZ
MRGKFITFEGSEGSGKSTQISLILKYLKKKGHDVLLIREPGATSIGESIRRVLLNVKNTKISDECETLLYMSARAQLVVEVILPALKKGKLVLCDRFLDSTLAYQGYGNGTDIKFIKQVGAFATQSIIPDVTLLFDIDAKVGLARLNRSKDRIEQKALTYHKKVRNGYLDLAQKNSKRIKVIDANLKKEEIHVTVKKHIAKIL